MITIKEMCDYRTVTLPEKVFELRVANDSLEQELYALRERFLTIVPVQDCIQNGDFVVVTFPDDTENADVCRLQINIGRGIFGDIYENSMIGKCIGDSVNIRYHGKAVSATVESVKRRILPELSDSLVKRMEIPEVTTIEEYRNYAAEKLGEEMKPEREGAVYRAAFHQILQRSEIEVFLDDDLDYLAFYEGTMKEAAKRAVGTDSTADEVLAEAMGMKDRPIEECYEELKKSCEESAIESAFGKFLAAQNGVVFDREDIVKRLFDYINDIAPDGSIEVTDYMIDQNVAQMYIQYFQDTIFAHYKDRYKVVIE